MRKPAKIKPWISHEKMVGRLREASNVGAYKNGLTVWLTAIGLFIAHEVARVNKKSG